MGSSAVCLPLSPGLSMEALDSGACSLFILAMNSCKENRAFSITITPLPPKGYCAEVSTTMPNPPRPNSILGSCIDC
ncbi:KRAB domain-containing zinc finger protein [Sarotherodon galilaeus]